MPTWTKNIDGGWAWVILACGFCSFFLNGFLSYSMGIITEAMLEVFDGDLSLTSAVGSAIIGAQCCSGPLAGIIIKRFGCRTCTMLGGIIATSGLAGASFSRNLYTILICGVITGIGYGFPLTSGSVIVGKYFRRLRPMAAGIAMTGGGFGMFVGPPLVRFWIDQYSLHGMFLIMAGVASHFCVIGSLMRPLPERPHYLERDIKSKVNGFKADFGTCCKSSSVQHTCHFHILKNTGFMMYLCSIFLWSVGESACFLHLPNYCILQGSSKTDTSLLFTAMGIGNIVSRLFTGFAANDEGIKTIILHAGQVGIAGILTGLFPLFSRTYGGQMAYAVALGIYSSGANTLLNPVVVQLVGLDDLALGFGLVNMAIGSGYLTGSPVAGAIVDYGASYKESFIFAGFMYLLSSLSAMLIPLFHYGRDDHVVGIGSTWDITIAVEETATGNDKMDTFKDPIRQLNTAECELEPLQQIQS